MIKTLITGSGSGLGWLIAECMQAANIFDVIPYDIRNGNDVRHPFSGMAPPPELDILINCAGFNIIDYAENVSEYAWDKVMDINAKGMFFMTQACLPELRASHGTVLNIVSNAAHVPMRCSAAYNASKAAALMITRQLARELAPDVTVFSVSPNKLAHTGMSIDVEQQVMDVRGWTRDEAREHQSAALLTGEETPPELVAQFIVWLLSSKDRHRYLTGCDIPYGA